MTKSKLKKVASTSKKKVSKAVKKPVKTVKKTAKVAVSAAKSAKSEAVKAVAPKKCNEGLCKFTVFVVGMVAGALLFLFLTSFSGADYGQTNTWSLNRFNIFKSPTTVQTQDLNLTTSPSLNTGGLLKPNVDGN